jgi:hypothetical protein
VEGWNITWLGMPNIIPMDAQKSQEIVNSQGKLIKVEENFLDIGKQMLKTSWFLNTKSKDNH